MQEVIKIIRDFMIDRPILAANNTDPGQMHKLLLDEIAEYEAETDPEKKARELADVLWLVISTAILTGVDIEAEVREKGARNHLKRESVIFQSGDHKQKDQEARDRWKNSGGEEWFYGIDR